MYCHDHALENDVIIDCETLCSVVVCMICGKERENDNTHSFWKKSNGERIDACDKCISRAARVSIVKRYSAKSLGDLEEVYSRKMAKAV